MPASFSEDHTSNLRGAALEPMGRIFVMEPRRQEARAIIAELIGADPPTQSGR